MEKQTLMIHAWHDQYLDIKLDDYILSFDDGLYSQLNGIKKIIKKFPNIEIYYYCSTNIIESRRPKNPPKLVESDVAHDHYFRTGSKEYFINFYDLYVLSEYNQVHIGLHGHNHLNLKKLRKEESCGLHDQFKIFKEDTELMFDKYLDLVQYNIIDIKDKVHYCTPYNDGNSLFTLLIKQTFKKQLKRSHEDIIIVGDGRLDILDFEEAPTFFERYNEERQYYNQKYLIE